jgi:probable phosphoglycerate mutase
VPKRVKGEDADGPGITRIVAVRHGETVWNAEMRMQGQLDTELSERGRRQARRTAAALADEGIEAIVSSDLVRAAATAAAIAETVGLPVTTDVGLRERSFGAFQGYTYAEIDARWPAEAARWRRHDPLFAPDGGETLVEFDERAVAAVTRIAERERGRTVLVVTHGGVLDCLYRAATGLGLDAPRSWQLGNAAVNRVLFTGERFTLVGWSDTSHLEDGTLDDESEGDCPTVPRAAE